MISGYIRTIFSSDVFHITSSQSALFNVKYVPSSPSPNFQVIDVVLNFGVFVSMLSLLSGFLNTSDEKIVRIYPEGNSAVIYNNLKGGKAIVTATYKGKTYSCNVVSYSLYKTNISREEGTGFDYDESAKNMDELVNTETF